MNENYKQLFRECKFLTAEQWKSEKVGRLDSKAACYVPGSLLLGESVTESTIVINKTYFDVCDSYFEPIDLWTVFSTSVRHEKGHVGTMDKIQEFIKDDNYAKSYNEVVFSNLDKVDYIIKHHKDFEVEVIANEAAGLTVEDHIISHYIVEKYLNNNEEFRKLFNHKVLLQKED